MNPRIVVLVVVMVLLTIVNALWPRSPSPISVSSFGRAGSGHGALYDVLVEVEAARGRSLEAVSRLAGAETLWWIDPVGVCDGRIAMAGEVDVLDAEEVAWQGRRWIEQGGVGVVFLQAADPGGPLPEDQQDLVLCDAIAGIPLPKRSRLGSRRITEAFDAESASPADGDPLRGVVDGPLVRAPRKLAQQSAWAFEESLDWTAVAELEAAGDAPRPFVLERGIGEGRLVVVADSGFTHNRWLDAADSAPLAFDLVRRYGPPRFDEREHGLLPETGMMRFIVESDAFPVFLGLALLGGLYAWRGAALPARSVEEFDPATPTLETYVSSMATLYAGTRDHTRVLERYREFTVARLKRHFGLSGGWSGAALAERIQRDRPVRPELIARLTEPSAVVRSAELMEAARELDELVTEVTS